jgi:hypothetical protein
MLSEAEKYRAEDEKQKEKVNKNNFINSLHWHHKQDSEHEYTCKYNILNMISWVAFYKISVSKLSHGYW